MIGAVVERILKTYLGQYLELSDTEISMGSEIRLDNVCLKESAFSELGLPVKILHGKVSKLVINIPFIFLQMPEPCPSPDGSQEFGGIQFPLHPLPQVCHTPVTDH